jgi:transcriptional regulator with XRE-family HTH domain
MIDRIELILKTQNLTPTQFADAIGIQRSSMSHILARRNNPSLDFVMKVLKRFPEINAEWLLSGKNQMLNAGGSYPAPNASTSSATIASEPTRIPEFAWDTENGTDYASTPLSDRRSAPADASRTSGSSAYSDMKQVIEPVEMPGFTVNKQHEKIPPSNQRDSNKQSEIERIIVFFTDGTFKNYI